MAAKFFTTGGRQTFNGFNEHVTIRPSPSLDKKSMDFGPEKKRNIIMNRLSFSKNGLILILNKT